MESLPYFLKMFSNMNKRDIIKIRGLIYFKLKGDSWIYNLICWKEHKMSLSYIFQLQRLLSHSHGYLAHIDMRPLVTYNNLIDLYLNLFLTFFCRLGWDSWTNLKSDLPIWWLKIFEKPICRASALWKL